MRRIVWDVSQKEEPWHTERGSTVDKKSLLVGILIGLNIMLVIGLATQDKAIAQETRHNKQPRYQMAADAVNIRVIDQITGEIWYLSWNSNGRGKSGQHTWKRLTDGPPSEYSTRSRTYR